MKFLSSSDRVKAIGKTTVGESALKELIVLKQLNLILSKHPLTNYKPPVAGLIRAAGLPFSKAVNFTWKRLPVS